MGLQDNRFLGKEETASIFYHDIFDYPLNVKEIIKWRVGKKKLFIFKTTKEILNKDGYYFLKGRENILYKKALRKRASKGKIEIAKKSAFILSKFSTIEGVFVTGALAMGNAEENADIDLMIITKKNLLWTTRLLVYLILKIINLAVRKPEDINQKNKLCLNIWLDESSLIWSKKDRNIYTAHEIVQVVSLVNKNNIYEKFISKNNWVLDYWPNAVRVNNELRITNYAKNPLYIILNLLFSIFEKISYRVQYKYMKRRITREVVTLHKAIFHPRSWGEVVLQKLSS